jgi:hypothetical protein
MVETEDDSADAGIQLQPLQQGVFRHAAEGDVTVFPSICG